MSKVNAYFYLLLVRTVKPFIIRGPHNQIVLEGSSVTFSCRVGGDPMPDVLWLRTASGGNMPLGRILMSFFFVGRTNNYYGFVF